MGINAIPVQRRPYPTVANACNVEFNEVLELDPGGMVNSGNTGSREDEMDLLGLCQRFSYFGSFVVTSTNVLGDAVYIADLGPCSEVKNFASGILDVSLLTYLSLPFSFWRGSLRFKFIAVASPNHTLRLQICSHIGFQASGLTINQAFGQYMCTFDVCGVSEVIVEFPWRSPTDWKKVLNGSYPSMEEFSMGQMSVRVLNQLQAPEVVSQSINIMVFLAAGPDYMLGYLGNNGSDFVPGGAS